jgi:hypothetical protein
MPDSIVSVGDIGVTLEARTYRPLHDASCVQLCVQKPSGNVVWVSEIADINSGVIKYTTVEGDFNEPGFYKIQAQVILVNGSQFTGSTHTIKVNTYFG